MSSGFVVRQEEDRLNARRLMAIFVASIVVSAAAVVVAAWLLGVLAPPTPKNGAPFHPAQIGTVEQTLVRDTERGVDLRRAQRRALETWGWVDRDAGVVHIPIDVAMDVMSKADAGSTP